MRSTAERAHGSGPLARTVASQVISVSLWSIPRAQAGRLRRVGEIGESHEVDLSDELRTPRLEELPFRILFCGRRRQTSAVWRAITAWPSPLRNDRLNQILAPSYALLQWELHASAGFARPPARVSSGAFRLLRHTCWRAHLQMGNRATVLSELPAEIQEAFKESHANHVNRTFEHARKDDLCAQVGVHAAPASQTRLPRLLGISA